MTNRVGSLENIWAQDGDATDPDLDTTHPIYQEHKYAKGWIVEKEPHQWINFITQATDLKLQFVAAEQFSEWDSEVNYAPNSVARKGDDVYINISGDVSLNKDPATETTIWSKILSASSSEVTAFQQGLETKITNHLNADNPHNDNIHTIGGYESGEINDFLGKATDPRTIVYHEAQSGGSVHGETPAQVGTLPKAGGHFTGDVRYLGGLTLGTALIMQDGPDVKISNGGGSIILEADGDSVYGEDASGVRSEITSVANFQRQQRAVNNMFAHPQPIIDIDMRFGTFSCLGIGKLVVDSGTNTPTFSDKGWKIEPGYKVSGLEFHINRTDIVEYYAGEVFRRTIVTSTVALDGEIDLMDIMTRIAPDATDVQRIVVWPEMNEYQKSTLLPQYPSLHIANDTSSTPGTAWYVEKDDVSIYSMPNATAPKGGQYIGAFQMGADGVRGARVDGTAVWTTSDATVVQIVGNTQANGQAVVNILKAGTAELTVKWKGMTSKVIITAV